MTTPIVIYSDPAMSAEEAMRSFREKEAKMARLTIGIPTHDRPEMLVRAVRSALTQTMPVRVLVSDDNMGAGARKALWNAFPREMAEERIHHRYSVTMGLWSNWNACARACETEFFLWLQDDDVLLPHAAARVVAAFDKFPEADIWLACNKLGLDGRHCWWNNGNGPWVPLDSRGGVDQWEGEIFAPTCYFLSWSLSPAVAFRRGPRFAAALESMPPDCAIFAERLILVGMGAGGRFVADPCVAGLWVQHSDNEHRKLHDDQPRQTRILIRELDAAMGRLGDRWREILGTWCKLQHPNWITGWIGDFDHAEREGGRSRYGEAIREVMIRSLDGRVKYVPIRNRLGRLIDWVKRKAAR